MTTITTEICVWSDGSWCNIDEIDMYDMLGFSDDYRRVIFFDPVTEEDFEAFIFDYIL